MPIPIIDIFAGPGGLGEGFSSWTNLRSNRIFKIKLSIEKDVWAHQTLKLRSFYREFEPDQIPDEYYQFVRGQITIDELYTAWPEQAVRADREAWCGTLGRPDDEDTNGVSNEEVDVRIREALDGERNWLLIGGPPCQAYSLVGRARRQEIILNEAKDKRVGLYKEYLRIIAVHKPAVFVMENVKGILSAKTEDEHVFRRILSDLSEPVTACIAEGTLPDENAEHIRYRIYSLTTPAQEFDLYGNPTFKPKDFIIRAEEHHIPQRRHRVILLGVRQDMPGPNRVLEKHKELTLASVIGNMPKIRSGITRVYSHTSVSTDETGKEKKKRHYEKLPDTTDRWLRNIQQFDKEIDGFLAHDEQGETGEYPESLGQEYWPDQIAVLAEDHPLRGWFADKRLGGMLQHMSRKHLLQDLKRYLFAARYTIKNGTFPRLDDYRKAGNDLLPDHANAGSGKFTDRFRVQLEDIAATTVTSHIAKDGHYFIHYDPSQCRSFTVREAARVQTFPDNYFFCGERTQQFHQVGNAVPPYLAWQIAAIVADIFNHNENG